METYKKGVLGPFSGKIGTLIGSTWNGMEDKRSLPKAFTKAATHLQHMQRAKFGFANGFPGPIGSPFCPLSFCPISMDYFPLSCGWRYPPTTYNHPSNQIKITILHPNSHKKINFALSI